MSRNLQQSQQLTEESRTLQTQNRSNIIKLRAPKKEKSKSNEQGVRWKSDVIDNENMNKKKTKICCIFHPNVENEEDLEDDYCTEHSHDEPHEESSSSSSESENEKDLDFDERRRRRIERRHRKLKENSTVSPNAYEIQPDYTEYRKRMQNKNKLKNIIF
ncbi:hypothetical protein TPHA_0D00730 [Tetrapisispora phaffii CBS 4417]|uniref:Type 1 phosphatases regulator n=1 Tax=Tetrapisispora phaffii (strain ATCC 24235 / CBS 4417 / NBRC 1672 / NRRL Y-8282 / UCD 70-5) TaxID=1071381 RepID=G8BS95_TETPH|nr:hypothetical protein TPHA_0D00730 [Tetrapisispora phaffii CBS 4417]CCE62716.1 hypothetical protein TPHA_0D00730 [Tetrapisispora phaffii CBS 4417]